MADEVNCVTSVGGIDLSVDYLQRQEHHSQILQCSRQPKDFFDARLCLLAEVIQKLQLTAVDAAYVAINGLFDELVAAPDTLDQNHQAVIHFLQHQQPRLVLFDLLVP